MSKLSRAALFGAALVLGLISALASAAGVFVAAHKALDPDCGPFEVAGMSLVVCAFVLGGVWSVLGVCQAGEALLYNKRRSRD